MYFICGVYEPLCLLLLFCPISEADCKIPNYFADFELLFYDARKWISEVYSKVEDSMPTFDKIYTRYRSNLNSLTSVTDEVAKSLYDRFNILVSNPDGFLTHLSMNNSLWKYWPFKEFSNNPCLFLNTTDPDYMIKHDLYAQHLAQWSINAFLKTHLNNDHPLKPLVMSFHGPTGCGKSFVSKMIADTLYKKGLNSKHVHVYYGNIDFSQENKKVLHQTRLLKEIDMFTKICGKSLFIFDDIDKMIPGVIDVLIPYLQFDEKCSKFDFRKSIFIFISNIGSSIIEDIAFDAWLQGLDREDITIEEFSELKDAAFSSSSGLYHSEIVKSNLIDVFVPFLPLEKNHVKQCIQKELKSRDLPYDEAILERVASQFVYKPSEFQLFSASGCKKVSQKVDLYGESDV